MHSSVRRAMLCLVVFAVSPPALAGNSLIVPNLAVTVAKSGLTVTPDREWNKLGARPGRNSETWTLDGDSLNGINFYGGIQSGRTLFREVSKRTKPLPHFSTTMLLTDVPDFLENSYRIALDTSLFTVEPVKFLAKDGVHFTYSFRRQGEDISRKGDATAAIVGGRLFMITFEAPALHYFDRDIGAYRRMVGTAKLPSF
jgi:hypothetical protein